MKRSGCTFTWDLIGRCKVAFHGLWPFGASSLEFEDFLGLNGVFVASLLELFAVFILVGFEFSIEVLMERSLIY